MTDQADLTDVEVQSDLRMLVIVKADQHDASIHSFDCFHIERYLRVRRIEPAEISHERGTTLAIGRLFCEGKTSCMQLTDELICIPPR